MFYRLTKGTLSRIRRDSAGVKELQAQGYALDGACDENGNVISTAVVFDEPVQEHELTDAPKKRGPKPKGDKE